MKVGWNINILHTKGLSRLKNKHLSKINMDGIANLLLEFAKAQTIKEFSEEEQRGVIKFMVYLIDKWEEETYVQ